MPTSADDCIHAAISCLETARRMLNDDIRHYPGPIAGCDGEFNHLLATRRRVTAALGALAMSVETPTPRHPDAFDDPMMGTDRPH